MPAPIATSPTILKVTGLDNAKELHTKAEPDKAD